MKTLFLHEAIGKALDELSNKTGSYKEISEIISRDSTYLDKHGFPPLPKQISARVNKYGQYFDKVQGGVKLIRPVR